MTPSCGTVERQHAISQYTPSPPASTLSGCDFSRGTSYSNGSTILNIFSMSRCAYVLPVPDDSVVWQGERAMRNLAMFVVALRNSDPPNTDFLDVGNMAHATMWVVHDCCASRAWRVREWMNVACVYVRYVHSPTEYVLNAGTRNRAPVFIVRFLLLLDMSRYRCLVFCRSRKVIREHCRAEEREYKG